MIFYALTFAGPWERCWKSEPERRGLHHLLRAPFDVNASENIGWFLLLHKNILKCRKTLEKLFRKIFLPLTVMPPNVLVMLFVYVLKTPLPGQMITSFWNHQITFVIMHTTDADIRFCDGPGMLVSAWQVYNSTWIALLKHGLWPVKHGW